MITINLREFQTYDHKSLYEFILMQDQLDFQLILPRQFKAGINDNVEVADEYLTAALAGQKMADISQTIAYTVPAIVSKDPILITLTNVVLEKFIDTLYEIIHGVYELDSSDDFLNYRQECAKFLGNVWEEDFICYTIGLAYIANELFMK